MLEANFISGYETVTVQGLTQWDKGQKLQITGLASLPATFQVHFANTTTVEAIVMLGSTVAGVGTVDIPNSLLESELDFKAWIYVIDANGSETIKTILFPVAKRTKPADFISEPNPTEQSLLEQTMTNVNAAADNLQSQINSTNAQVALKANQTSLDTTNVQVNLLDSQKADVTYVDFKTQANNLAYKESYATLSALQTAYPGGDTYNHAVLSDNFIYTWVNSSWTNTQIQAVGTGLANAAVTERKTNFINRINYITGTFLDDTNNNFVVGTSIGDTTNFAGANLAVSPIISVTPGDVIRLRTIYTGTGKIALAGPSGIITNQYALTSSGIQYDGTPYSLNQITIPSGVTQLRFLCRKQTITTPIHVSNVAIMTINRNLPDYFVAYDNLDIPELSIEVNGSRKRTSEVINNHETRMEFVEGNVSDTIQWNGKIAAVIGSSLTANGGWSDVLKERFGFSKMYNRGAGGTTLSNFSGYGLSDYVTGENVYTDTANYTEDRLSVFCDDTGSATRPYEWRAGSWYSSASRINLLPADADLVLVDLCTNDFFRSWNQSYIDEATFIADTTIKTVYQESVGAYAYDDTKYCDAFMLMIKRIKSTCPNAKIVVWGMIYNSTITTTNDSFSYYMQLIDKTKEMCRRTGVYFIDTFAEMGVNVYNSSEYIEDGVHPYKATYATQKGKYAVANVITKHLKNIYPKDYGVA